MCLSQRKSGAFQPLLAKPFEPALGRVDESAGEPLCCPADHAANGHIGRIMRASRQLHHGDGGRSEPGRRGQLGCCAGDSLSDANRTGGMAGRKGIELGIVGPLAGADRCLAIQKRARGAGAIDRSLQNGLAARCQRMGEQHPRSRPGDVAAAEDETGSDRCQGKRDKRGLICDLACGAKKRDRLVLSCSGDGSHEFMFGLGDPFRLFLVLSHGGW
jgi:hypothetical protein